MNEIRLEHDSLMGGGEELKKPQGRNCAQALKTPDNANKQGKDLKALFCC